MPGEYSTPEEGASSTRESLGGLLTKTNINFDDLSEHISSLSRALEANTDATRLSPGRLSPPSNTSVYGSPRPSRIGFRSSVTLGKEPDNETRSTLKFFQDDSKSSSRDILTSRNFRESNSELTADVTAPALQRYDKPSTSKQLDSTTVKRQKKRKKADSDRKEVDGMPKPTRGIVSSQQSSMCDVLCEDCSDTNPEAESSSSSSSEIKDTSSMDDMVGSDASSPSEEKPSTSETKAPTSSAGKILINGSSSSAENSELGEAVSPTSFDGKSPVTEESHSFERFSGQRETHPSMAVEHSKISKPLEKNRSYNKNILRPSRDYKNYSIDFTVPGLDHQTTNDVQEAKVSSFDRRSSAIRGSMSSRAAALAAKEVVEEARRRSVLANPIPNFIKFQSPDSSSESVTSDSSARRKAVPQTNRKSVFKGRSQVTGTETPRRSLASKSMAARTAVDHDPFQKAEHFVKNVSENVSSALDIVSNFTNYDSFVIRLTVLFTATKVHIYLQL